MLLIKEVKEYSLMKFTWKLSVLAMLVMLAGCGGSSGTMMDDDGMSGEGADYGDTDDARSSGMSDDGYQEGGAFDDGQGPGGMLENRVIYFQFDKADIDSESLQLLAGHGQYLASTTGIQMRLEGHADERGSREYNIGLGERRAQAVRQVLLLQGASASQLSTVSYGEERPAALGSDEESWLLNRRVELVYAP
jgi:peptidoglycan-associated lipoprotein